MNSRHNVQLRKNSTAGQLPLLQPSPTQLGLADSDEELPPSLRPKPSSSEPNRGVCERLRRLCRGLVQLGKGRVEAEGDDDAEVDGAAYRRPCRCTFVFDPAGRFIYSWGLVVSVAFCYNLWIVGYRFAFDEISDTTIRKWFLLDYFADGIYFLDILVSMRTGFLKAGVLITQPRRIRRHYMDTSRFYLDCLSLLPLEFLYLSVGFVSAVRAVRIFKYYKFWLILDATERHTNFPNVCRCLILLHRLVLFLHWNACLVYALRASILVPAALFDASDPYFNYIVSWSLGSQLLFSSAALPEFYALRNASSVPMERQLGSSGLLFLTAERLCGIILLASIIGNVTNIVLSNSHARKVFQSELDGVKTYMRLRNVPTGLQIKVVRWFDYLWASKKSGREDDVLSVLPDRLKAEVAIQVHLETLKKVEIFRNTEPGFLCELVLRLKPALFSPGDFVCRKGEVGKEMYIVNRGKLRVLGDDGGCLALLSAGSYFGEISLLNLGSEGNRRTAAVMSVGYSDLFCLSRRDIAEVLEDYPAARDRLEQIAHRRLREKIQKSTAPTPAVAPTPPLFQGLREGNGWDEAEPRRFSAPPSLLHRINQVSHLTPHFGEHFPRGAFKRRSSEL